MSTIENVSDGLNIMLVDIQILDTLPAAMDYNDKRQIHGETFLCEMSDDEEEQQIFRISVPLAISSYTSIMDIQVVTSFPSTSRVFLS